MIYYYDVFLAQVERFSMLRSYITISHIPQHGHPRYLGALQKTSGLNDTNCSYEAYFLDFENDKISKKMPDFRSMSDKTV